MPLIISSAITLGIVTGVVFINRKTSDRFTGTQGAVLSSAVSSIQSDVAEMARLQSEAWERIECRQIIFIAANNRATKDFDKLLESCQ